MKVFLLLTNTYPFENLFNFFWKLSIIHFSNACEQVNYFFLSNLVRTRNVSIKGWKIISQPSDKYFIIMIGSVELQFAGIKLDFSIHSDILFINTSCILMILTYYFESLTSLCGTLWCQKKSINYQNSIPHGTIMRKKLFYFLDHIQCTCITKSNIRI